MGPNNLEEPTQSMTLLPTDKGCQSQLLYLKKLTSIFLHFEGFKAHVILQCIELNIIYYMGEQRRGFLSIITKIVRSFINLALVAQEETRSLIMTAKRGGPSFVTCVIPLFRHLMDNENPHKVGNCFSTVFQKNNHPSN